MKIRTWIYFECFIIVIGAVIFLLLPNIKDVISRKNCEQSNLNLNFVGSNRGHYSSSRACLLEDGSVFIASAMKHTPGLISLIKLTPGMKLAWEKQLSEQSLAFGTRYFHHHSSLSIADMQIIQDKCYIYAIRLEEGKYKPVIVSTDLEGNLLGYYPIPYPVSSSTQPTGLMMDDHLFFSWYNDIDKILTLDRISMTNRKIADSKFIYLIQDSLRFTSITSSPVRKNVFISTYDPNRGSSLLSYNAKDGLKKLSDTDRLQTLQVVAYIDSSLYVIATKDTSLVVGAFHLDRAPDQMVAFQLTSNLNVSRALIKNNSFFYIGMNVVNTSFNQDVTILQYQGNYDKHGEFNIRGKFAESLNQLLLCPDGNLLAIGNSDSHNSGVGSRVFVTKFKL